MKPKSLIPLVIILAILLGLAVYKKKSEHTTTIEQQAGLVNLVPEGLTKGDIAKVEMYAGKKPDAKLVLAFDSGSDKWRVTSHFNAPARKETVEKCLDAVAKMKGEPRATASKDSDLDEYSLSDAEAFHVLAYKKDQTEPLVHLLVGKSPSYQTVFVRREGSNDIFVDSTNLKQQAGIYDEPPPRPGQKEEENAKDKEVKTPEATTWLDKEVVKIDTPKVTKLAMTMPDKSLVFERHEKPKPPAEAAPAAAPEAAVPGAPVVTPPPVPPAPAAAPTPPAPPVPAAPAPVPAPAPPAPAPPPPVAPPPPGASVVTPAPVPAEPAPAAPAPSGSAEEEKEQPPIAVTPGGAAKPAEQKPEYEWVMVSGGAGLKLKPKAIENLVQKTTTITAADVVDPSKKKDWGLEPPAYSCVISVEGQPDIRIEGGRPDPSGDGYLRIADSKDDLVYKINKYTFEQIFPKGSDVFELPNFAVDKKALDAIELSTPGGKAVLAKQGEAWQITAPVCDMTPQATTMDAIASALAAFKPADYADSDAGLGEPTRVAVFKAAGQSHTLKLFTDAKHLDGMYAKMDDSPVVLVMARADVNKVFVAPKDLFEHKLLSLEEPNVKEVHVSSPAGSYSIDRAEANWKVTVNGAASEALPDKCDALVADISNLQASDILFGQAELQEPAENELRVKMNAGEEHIYHFTAEKDGARQLKLSGKGEIFTVAGTDVAKLFPAADTLKKPEAPPAPPAAPATPAPAPAPEAAPAAPAPAPAPEAAPVAPALAPAPEAAPVAPALAPAPEAAPVAPAPAPAPEAAAAAPAPAPAPEAAPAAPAPAPTPEAAPAPPPPPAPPTAPVVVAPVTPPPSEKVIVTPAPPPPAEAPPAPPAPPAEAPAK